ncbi:hypothetical protein GSI_08267 [Ganoderma sinense ZZ0214-1]|uniref:RING-type domain-containing protein n=1 Tax=Ganoderma sinense ZZ0214-1 TaxID=1077348 RepID=A0A2G8S776_9APHY|nr:hypothetical protein GSI_08267 [Ganoderma sinense ZZ0214-1]
MQSPLARTQSPDEFDTLPDDYDFSAVQVLPRASPPQPRPHPDPDEYDIYNETDTFADIDLDTIAELGPPAQPVPGPFTSLVAQPPTNTQPPPERGSLMGSQHRRGSGSGSTTSTQYSFDDVNSAFLEEVNAIERNAVRTAQAASDPSPIASQVDEPPLTQPAPPNSGVSRTTTSTTSSLLGSQITNVSSTKRKRSFNDDLLPTSNKKSKGKGKPKDPHASARAILTEMEESVQCPICCEIFVAPHVGIPCGHSYCGDCCIRWMKQNPGRRPSCPTCRAQLTNNILVVPNYSLQHAIDKHIAALSTTGVVDWQPTGVRYQERQRRQGQWAEMSGELAVLQSTQWDLQNPDSPPNSQLVAFINAQAQAALEESSSSEDESADEDSAQSSPDLFAFFSTPPRQA